MNNELERCIKELTDILMDDESDVYNNMVQSFFPDKNIQDLTFLYTDGWIATFSFNDVFMCYDLYDNKWEILCMEILTPATKNKCKLATLINGSSEKIEYMLFPHMTEETNSPCEINIDYIADMTNYKMQQVYNSLSYDNITINWVNDMQLSIHNHKYIITKGEEFLSGFIDKETHFQLGDVCTIIYILQNGDLLVQNCGDVPSIVIIKYYE